MFVRLLVMTRVVVLLSQERVDFDGPGILPRFLLRIGEVWNRILD
jgi:hypothetical protein